MKKTFIIFLLSLFVFTACASPQQKPMAEPKSSSIFEKGKVQKIKIINNNANCRTGLNDNFSIIQKLPKNKIYDVIGERKNRYVIETEDGRVGTVNPSDAQPYVESPDLSNQKENMTQLTPNEQEMLRLLNGERTQRGLKPLKLDMEITKVARLKSQDMIDKNYFSHNSPTYGSPFDMMKKFGIEYIYAGENLAGNPSVEVAHNSLMNSEGHRKNILNPNFTHIGIGIKEGSRYGKICTQMFVGR